MLNTLVSSLLIDIIELLKHHAQFFDLNHKERAQLLKEKSHFSKSLAEYLETTTKQGFLNDMEEITKNLLMSPFYQNRAIGMKMVELLSTYFDRDLDMDLENIVNAEEGGNYILVQSPLKLDPETKNEMREELVKKYPNSSPIFVVNKNLIGGLRIYIDGKTEDLSWVSKINKLTSISNIS